MKRFWLTLLAAGILVLGGCSRRGENSPPSQVSGAAPSAEGVIDPETDIGRVCVFLASEDAAYITGETISLQGGSGRRP